MDVVVTSDIDRLAAEAILHRWPKTEVLGLPTGQTPEGIYGWLVQYFYDGKLRFADKETFNVDEYFGLAPNDTSSYRATMCRLLMQHIDLPAARFHVLPGLTTDPDGACREYEVAIRGAGGIDLCLLGIGINGHIAFNEPGSAWDTRTRLVELSETTRRRNAGAFDGDVGRVPTEALTFGIGTILESREILLVAKGADKADPIARMVRGEPTTAVPASVLQEHPRCTVMINPAAASTLLHGTTKDAPVIFAADGRAHSLEVRT